MTSVELLARALPAAEPPEGPKPGVCCVTGTSGPTVARKHAILPSFTNLDLLRAPQSERVSVDAWRVLTHRLEPGEGKKRGGQPLIQSSWVCTRFGLTLLDRLGVREQALAGVPGDHAPWCGYVTTSYKKHGSLRAPVNTHTSQRWLFEQSVVDCSDRVQVAEWWERIHTARVAGIPRPVIEALDASVHLLRTHGAAWTEFERWARPKYQSALYRFLTYLLPGKEELARSKENDDAREEGTATQEADGEYGGRGW